MRYNEIITERYTNGTWQNALVKMAQGYVYGLHPGADTCYAYAGSQLAKLNPPDGTIRFWGLRASGVVIHGDVLLPDGKVISDMPPEKYTNQAEIVHTLSVEEFKQWVDASLKMNHASESSQPSKQSHSAVQR